MSTAYIEKLKNPKWQRKRLQILERDEWVCQACFDGESTLHVHHLWYEKGKDPWEYPDKALMTLCELCHQEETDDRHTREKLLLRALRQQCGFLSSTVNDLACGFADLKKVHADEVLGAALSWALSNEEMMRSIVRSYFEYLERKHKKRESGRI